MKVQIMPKQLYASCGWGDIFCLGTKGPLVASGAVTALLPQGEDTGRDCTEPLCVLRAAIPMLCPNCPAASPGRGNEQNAT